jgi:hypothetical protein
MAWLPPEVAAAMNTHEADKLDFMCECRAAIARQALYLTTAPTTAVHGMHLAAGWEAWKPAHLSWGGTPLTACKPLLIQACSQTSCGIQLGTVTGGSCAGSGWDRCRDFCALLRAACCTQELREGYTYTGRVMYGKIVSPAPTVFSGVVVLLEDAAGDWIKVRSA